MISAPDSRILSARDFCESQHLLLCIHQLVRLTFVHLLFVRIDFVNLQLVRMTLVNARTLLCNSSIDFCEYSLVRMISARTRIFCIFQLARITFVNHQLVRTDFVNLQLVRTDFVNLQLVRTDFVNLQLVRIDFVNLQLVRIDFVNLQLRMTFVQLVRIDIV